MIKTGSTELIWDGARCQHTDNVHQFGRNLRHADFPELIPKEESYGIIIPLQLKVFVMMNIWLKPKFEVILAIATIVIHHVKLHLRVYNIELTGTLFKIHPSTRWQDFMRRWGKSGQNCFPHVWSLLPIISVLCGRYETAEEHQQIYTTGL